jgi:hypothetical protein
MLSIMYICGHGVAFFLLCHWTRKTSVYCDLYDCVDLNWFCNIIYIIIFIYILMEQVYPNLRSASRGRNPRSNKVNHYA